jgi:putative selenium metabolism protein SsnA
MPQALGARRKEAGMILLNATLANPGEPGQFHENVRVGIHGGRIDTVECGPGGLLPSSGEVVVDARGGLVLPGLVCAHTHFYGAFARGMSLPGEPAADFPHILENLWWRLDKLLTPEDITASALVFLCDAIRHGTTTVMDHHASPHSIDGSLDLIADAVQKSGVRGCLCYEMTDRDGDGLSGAGLAENQRFARRVQMQSGTAPAAGMLAASIGLHASFTLSDESLQAAAGLARDLGLGCHIHVAEDRSDQEDSLTRDGRRVVERLARAGVLGPKTIAAHCVHVSNHEMALLSSSGCRVVHNPRSNMNNAVGTAPVPSFLAAGLPVGLGNDGFSMNMFQEMKAAYFSHKQASGDPRTLGADQVTAMQWRHNASIAQILMNVPALGEITVGAPADLVILDYLAPTPVTAGNLAWHILFGVDGEHVRTTIVNGRVLMLDRQVVALDEERIHAEARRLAAALWQRASAS